MTVILSRNALRNGTYTKAGRLGEERAEKPSGPKKRRGPNPLSDSAVVLIKRDISNGVPLTEIARRRGASIYQVQNIKNGVCYADVKAAP